MDDIDESFMRVALAEARKAYYVDEIPIGAVIIHGDKILGKGSNLTERLTDVTAHAEILALTAASHYLQSKYLKECTLYVTIEPCPMCAAALYWAQIGTIVYGSPDNKRGYNLFNPSLLHPKTQVRFGVLQAECAKLMSDFFNAKRGKD